MSASQIPRTHLNRVPVDLLAVVVVVLAAALVALGTWVLVDRSTSGTESGISSTNGLASAPIAAMLRDRIAAFNSADGQAVAAFYTRAGVLEERDVTPAVVTRGNDQIGGRIHALSLLGLRLRSESPVIQLGRYVAEATSFPGHPDMGWILVYELGQDGKIAHQWVIGGTP